MNIRRTLPLRSLAVCNSSALTSSVNSILLPPRILFLEHYTTPGQFSFRKSLNKLAHSSSIDYTHTVHEVSVDAIHSIFKSEALREYQLLAAQGAVGTRGGAEWMLSWVGLLETSSVRRALMMNFHDHNRPCRRCRFIVHTADL